MLRRVREVGPALWVPVTWGFVAAAHVGVVGTHPVLVAHGVMLTMLVGFVGLSWTEMGRGVLEAWRLVILVGIPVTAAGLIGLLLTPPATQLLVVSLVGWMLLPAPALWYTATVSAAEGEQGAARVNHLAAGTTVAGVAAYSVALLVGGVATPTPTAGLLGIALVGLGQTIGIVDAVVRY